jgi:hypothetical protein
MTELTQAELAEELGLWPATTRAWTWAWQRCGRYDYRECLVYSTNSDHLNSRELSSKKIPSLRVAARYAAERPGRSPLCNPRSTNDADD